MERATGAVRQIRCTEGGNVYIYFSTQAASPAYCIHKNDPAADRYFDMVKLAVSNRAELNVEHPPGDHTISQMYLMVR